MSDSVSEPRDFLPFFIISSNFLRIGRSTIRQETISRNEIETVGMHSRSIADGLS